MKLKNFTEDDFITWLEFEANNHKLNGDKNKHTDYMQLLHISRTYTLLPRDFPDLYKLFTSTIILLNSTDFVLYTGCNSTAIIYTRISTAEVLTDLLTYLINQDFL